MTSPSTSAGLKTADAVIRVGPTIATGVHIITDGAADATVELFDHASAASGTSIFKITVTGADDSTPINLPLNGVYCKNGVYANITTSGTMGYIVYYR
jgi:hypothetical protein